MKTASLLPAGVFLSAGSRFLTRARMSPAGVSGEPAPASEDWIAAPPLCSGRRRPLGGAVQSHWRSNLRRRRARHGADGTSPAAHDDVLQLRFRTAGYRPSLAAMGSAAAVGTLAGASSIHDTSGPPRPVSPFSRR